MFELEIGSLSPRALVCFNQDGSIGLDVNSVPEAGTAIRTLKSTIREARESIRQLAIQCQRLRFEYGDWSRRQPTAGLGGSHHDILVRSAQAVQRRNRRIDLTTKLRPLHERRDSLNAMVLAANDAIDQLQAYAIDAALD